MYLEREVVVVAGRGRRCGTPSKPGVGCGVFFLIAFESSSFCASIWHVDLHSFWFPVEARGRYSAVGSLYTATCTCAHHPSRCYDESGL